jgi:hypothetical protein
MTRRTIGMVLVAIGAFVTAAAVTLFLAAPAVLVTLPYHPGDTDPETGELEPLRTVARGEGLTVFYPGDLTQRSGVAATAVRNTVGRPDGTPGLGRETAVWSTGVVVTDEQGTLITTTEFTGCLDRRLGSAVEPCPSASLNGSTSVRPTGQLFGFPLDTQRRDYDFFDTSTRAAFPARFVEETELSGVPLYLFEQTVPETVIDRREVPADLAGSTAGGTVTAEVVYSNTRTLWVDPATGVIVKGSEQIDQSLRGPGGTRGATLLAGTLTFDDATVAQQIGRVQESGSRIGLVNAAPLAVGILGAVLLVAGGLLMARPPARAGHRAGTRPLAGTRRGA